MNAIEKIDIAVFRFVNGQLTTGWLDSLMPFVTDKFNFQGAIIVAAVLIFALGKRRDRVGLLVLVAVVLSSDLACNTLKHLIGRVRPCNTLDNVRMVMACTKSYSFPSGHATNIFAAMVFLSFRYKKLTPAFLAFAALVAYSRVYVGVHYPFDIIGGAILGSLIAFAWTRIEAKAAVIYNDRYSRKEEIIEDDEL